MKYLSRNVDRHGNVRLYVRRPDGRYIRMRSAPGTQEFAQEYRAAFTPEVPELPLPPVPTVVKIVPRHTRYVYVVGGVDGPTQPVKIGMTGNPADRLIDIQNGNPRRLGVLHLFPVSADQARRLEKAAHRTLSEYRLAGEWFDIPAEIANEVILRCAERRQIHIRAPLRLHREVVYDYTAPER